MRYVYSVYDMYYKDFHGGIVRKENHFIKTFSEMNDFSLKYVYSVYDTKKDNIGIQFYHVKDGFDEMLQPLRMCALWN